MNKQLLMLSPEKYAIRLKQLRDSQRKWRIKNPERDRTNRKKWYKNNIQHLKEYGAIPENRIKRKIAQRKYNQNHPEVARRWRKEHRELDNASKDKYRRKNMAYYCSKVAERRAKMRGVFYNADANAFYKWVRSQEFVPCSYCGSFITGKESHIDHIVALSKGGAHIASNLCAACPKCNLLKHTMSADEFRKRLNNKVELQQLTKE
jgi:5-methylcytosine-specific restriction endonuclease McrA